MKLTTLCLLTLTTVSASAFADWGRPVPPPPPGFDHGNRGPGFDPNRGPDWGRPPPPPFHPRRVWRGSNTGQECGPYYPGSNSQPWGTSLPCPNMSPDGGPIGMDCDNYAPGTKCYGASYVNTNFVCTDPYNGQNSYQATIFNMYVCY